jgi:hypothetical protein
MRLGTVSNYRMRDYYADNPLALLEYLPYVLGLILLLSGHAHAQEPRTVIKPADPIATAPTHEVTVASNDGTMPMIYPNPLPKMRLGEIARTYRIIHLTAPKATKVANDEAPIVAEEPKEQK